MNSGYWGRSKPPAGSVLDTSHPLARGLVRLYTFSEGHGILCADLCQRSGQVGQAGLVKLATTDPWVDTERGPGVKFDGVATYLDGGASKLTTFVSGGKGIQFT